MDWNWFFSSLAQSVAAIVAIFAAFIITTIVNNRATCLRKKSRMKELLADSQHLKERLSARRFDFYNQQMLVRNLQTLFVMGRFNDKTTGETIATFYPPPRYMSQTDYIRQMDEFVKLEREVGGGQKAAIAAMFDKDLAEKVEEAKSEGERIRELVALVNHQCRLNKLQMEETESDPEKSSLVATMNVLMGILFLVGVIIPLAYLPFPANTELSEYPYFSASVLSPKSLLLVAVAFFFSWTILKLRSENRSNVYDIDERSKVQEFCKLGSFSPYLEHLDKI